MASSQPLDDILGTHPLYMDLSEAHIVRLIELLPGTPNDKVIGRLSIQQLEHAQNFDAISYVWGDAHDRVPMMCNGQEIKITRSLDTAFRRVRHSDRPRIVWADALCINQGNHRERSHQVSFMNRIYRHATQVLLCMGDDIDHGAEHVATLVNDHIERMSGYNSILEMPVLDPHDPVFADQRWRHLGNLVSNVWFSRAWVLQEAGVATNPRILYGNIEFSYRGLMKLAQWIVRCAAKLQPIAKIDLLTIHTDWQDWTQDWESTMEYKYTLLDFLSHAKGLGCKDPRDHVYAFIGHPLAQLGDGSGPIITPDYEKSKDEVYQELSVLMLQKLGLRVLSAVEHDETTILDDTPSWVVRWDMDIIQNSMGYYSGFYYRAAGLEELVNPISSLTMEGNSLKVRALNVGSVEKVYQFSASTHEWETSEATTAVQSASSFRDVLAQIRMDMNNEKVPCIYPVDQREDAFTLSLCAGLMTYSSAEEDVEQHRANAVAFFRLLSMNSSELQETKASSRRTSSQVEGDADNFWFDMSLSCKGRCFFVTENGHFGLGPWIMKAGDECLILDSARVPFIIREAEFEPRRLLGEAYVHGMMHGELAKGIADWKDVVLR